MREAPAGGEIVQRAEDRTRDTPAPADEGVLHDQGRDQRRVADDEALGIDAGDEAVRALPRLRIAPWALGTHGTLGTLRALRTGRALRAILARLAVLAILAGFALRTLRPGRTLRTLDAVLTVLAVLPGFALRAGRALRAGGTFGAGRSIGSR